MVEGVARFDKIKEALKFENDQCISPLDAQAVTQLHTTLFYSKTATKIGHFVTELGKNVFFETRVQTKQFDY